MTYCDDETKKSDYQELVESKEFIRVLIKNRQKHFFDNEMVKELNDIIKSAKEYHKRMHKEYMENYATKTAV